MNPQKTAIVLSFSLLSLPKIAFKNLILLLFFWFFFEIENWPENRVIRVRFGPKLDRPLRTGVSHNPRWFSASFFFSDIFRQLTQKKIVSKFFKNLNFFYLTMPFLILFSTIYSFFTINLQLILFLGY